MVSFEVNEKESGRTLEAVFFARYPGVPAGVFFRALRKRDVKVNGARTSDPHLKLTGGDRVLAYVDADAVNAAAVAPRPRIPVVFENKYVMVVEKPQGLLTEPDSVRPGEPSLLDLLRSEHGKIERGDRLDAQNSGASLELCHRLDRNTGGLLFVSKLPEYTAAVKAALNARYYKKIYAVRAVGELRRVLPADGSWRRFDAFLEKHPGESRVRVTNEPVRNAKPIAACFRYLGSRPVNGLTLSDAEAMLITGRTHQIRAQLANMGFPVAGDGKYGQEKANRLAGLKFQALWACCYEYDPQHGELPVAGTDGIALPEGGWRELLPQKTFESAPRFR